MVRSPFLLPVADLLGQDASSRPVSLEVTVDWGLEMSQVSGAEPVLCELTLHPASRGIAVTGTASFVSEDTCHRCLAVTATDRTASIGALFDTSGDDETYDLSGHEIDIEQMLRDEVLLSLPLVTTCRSGCVEVVDSAQNGLNTEAQGTEDFSRSPFAVLKDLLEFPD
ncbi:MAG: DUF177 domain-containing protein [Acidimicrobiia bacterium]